MAMNARGGPGIVLASTAYAAGIINQTFFVSLVLLSVITSLLAGSWLERIAAELGAPARQRELVSAAIPQRTRHYLTIRRSRPPGSRECSAGITKNYMVDFRQSGRAYSLVTTSRYGSTF